MPVDRSLMPGLFRFIAKDDLSAAAFLRAVAEAARLADDIADGDAENPHSAMASLLSLTLHTIPRNCFYRANVDTLAPALAQIAVEWAVSESFAKSPERTTRIFGFVYRESIERIAHLTALISGGTEHAARVMVKLHEIAHTGGETLEEWEAEHGPVRTGPA